MYARWVTLSVAILAMSSVACANASSLSPEVPACATPPSATAAGDDLAKLTDEQLARELLDLTGGANIGKQIGDKMMDSFRAMPNMPPGFIERFKANIHPEELVAMIVPIYLQHYDRATTMAAIRFYRSEPGQKIVKELPALTTDAMEAGKKWGADLAKKTLSELRGSSRATDD
jgi:hypothetical protein